MHANVMSLVPKLDEVQEFIHRNSICLAFITETCLRESIPESVVNIQRFYYSTQGQGYQQSRRCMRLH